MSELPLLILVLLLFAFLLRIDFIYYIAYVCIGVYAWSQWVTPRTLRRLKLHRSFAGNAFLGERVTVRLLFTNSSRLPIPWVQFVESVPVVLRIGQPARQALTFRGRETKTITYEVQAMRRGYYRLGPMLLTMGDVFGFMETGTRLPADYLTVYPRIIPLHQLGLSSRLPFGTLASRKRLFEDPARPAGVRDFRSGDSLRHINWKVSAHKESLLVKTFQPAISLATMILLNLNAAEYSPRNRYDGPEWSIIVAASLAAHLVGQRQPVGLAANGIDPLHRFRPGPARPAGEMQGLAFDEESGRLVMPPGFEAGSEPAASPLSAPIPPKNGREHLMKVLELLARIETAESHSFQRWAPSACLNLSWGITILAVTPTGDEETCALLHRLVRSGYNPVLLMTEPTASFGPIRERGRRLGFSAYHIAEERDLNQWRKVVKVGT
jgi:uncharacterized protein (DUF58 family)